MNSRACWLVAALTLVGCAGSSSVEIQSETLGAADESVGSLGSELSQGVPVGSVLRTTAGLNLRTGPGTGNSVRLVIPQGATVTTVNVTSPTNGWYNVKYNGVTGWSSGQYFTLVSLGTTTGGGTSGGTGDLSATRAGAIERAKSGVGCSYYWGHGSWIPNGASSNYGSCSGNCPSCSHAGKYGADCSGYVGKLWQVPSSNTSLTTDSHPYSTVSFNGSSSLWSTVSRGNVIGGDALVYNENGAGHIFLYESGDGWGSMWAYEAKGCAAGIVHNLRTASTAFKAIRRAGW